MSANKSTDVAVIGGGPGGYAAAFMAADLGKRVTLIDPKENPGGVCLYHGCIPSKALLHIAKLLSEAEEAHQWGVTFSKPKINLKKLRSWKEEVVETMTSGLGTLSTQRKVEHIKGMAKFTSSNSLIVKTNDGKEEILNFEHAILATGTEPLKLPMIDFKSKDILDSTSALDLHKIPKSMLVIGGGYIGLELGTVYATLGTKVSVVEMQSSLMSTVDKDLVNVLTKRLDTLFEDVYLSTKVTEVKEQKNGIKVTLLDKDEKSTDKLFEQVLVSIGRKPNTKNLGLELTSVKIDKRGFIVVDNQMKTNDPSIFAIGDIVGEPQLAHKATHEGRVAAEVIAGKKSAFEPQAIPAVVFTDPEIAWCGITHDEAKKKNLDVEIVRFPWAASGRAVTIGRTDGLTKLIIDKETERILGIGMAGVGVGEMIGEGVLAIEMGAVVTDLSLTIHQHPTLSETIMEAADIFHGTSTHYYRPKKK
ncbi:MAG: dihydrolipoyl dehydrogenase [Calditrichaeota bacterium]|nr:MAG: dihydrolipoyl dehydrogenase [Calditrichota bacterium]